MWQLSYVLLRMCIVTLIAVVEIFLTFITFLDHPYSGPADQYFRYCAMPSVSWYFFMSPFQVSLHLFFGRPLFLPPPTSIHSDVGHIWVCFPSSSGQTTLVFCFPGKFQLDIYIIILLTVCRSYQTAGRNSCSIVSGDVSNCSYRLNAHPVTSSLLSSA